MPRTKTSIDPKQISLLRQKTAATFGKNIGRGFECEALSIRIKKATDEYLSPQSLRRFFGFLDSGFNPSYNTLNILSRFCGYTDWPDFLTESSRGSYSPITDKVETQLYLDFYKLKLQHEQDINFHNACRIINTRILGNSALLEALAKPLAENPVSQVFFYERFPFIDGLCTGYDRGIRLYLQHKRDEQAQIFGLSLLSLGAFLSERNKLLQRNFTQLRQYRLPDSWHPFVIARYIGTHLLYHHLANHEAGKSHWLEEARRYGKRFSATSRIDYWNFPYYQFMICDYLNLIRQYPLSSELLFPFRQLRGEDVMVEDGYYDAFRIITAVSANAEGKPSHAGRKSQPVDLHNLGIAFAKYFTIQHLISASRFATAARKARMRELIEQLIRETGFTYFRATAD